MLHLSMKEIVLNESIKASDGYLAAYRKGTIDMYAQLGMAKEAMQWLWIDMEAYQNQ